MMDEEIRQALNEVREMKRMCGNINMKLTNIVTQRGQDFKKKLEAEYQRGFEDGKAVNDKGCEGCKYGGSLQGSSPCYNCSNYYKDNWTAKDDKIEVGDEVADKDGDKTIVTNIHGNLFDGLCSDGSTMADLFLGDNRKTGRHFDIAKILEDMRHD
jgi:hypothetical protein